MEGLSVGSQTLPPQWAVAIIEQDALAVILIEVDELEATLVICHAARYKNGLVIMALDDLVLKAVKGMLALSVDHGHANVEDAE